MEEIGALLRPLVRDSAGITVAVVPDRWKLDGSDITPKVTWTWSDEDARRVWVMPASRGADEFGPRGKLSSDRAGRARRRDDGDRTHRRPLAPGLVVGVGKVGGRPRAVLRRADALGAFKSEPTRQVRVAAFAAWPASISCLRVAERRLYLFSRAKLFVLQSLHRARYKRVPGGAGALRAANRVWAWRPKLRSNRDREAGRGSCHLRAAVVSFCAPHQILAQARVRGIEARISRFIMVRV